MKSWFNLLSDTLWSLLAVALLPIAAIVYVLLCVLARAIALSGFHGSCHVQCPGYTVVVEVNNADTKDKSNL